VLSCYSHGNAFSAAMDHWHPHSARIDRTDAVKRWAELEARTPSTRHDLRLRFDLSNTSHKKSARRFQFAGELLIVVIDFCLHARGH